ncbi:hypothetical protein [Bifidobacterium avesanii]|uniref:Uncharacterized protein n=1 Tax=Bifidobacterium avesanii TaxID=1798157 RepID=A0A7K3TE98_9BIFI|nr:hypothetical protein [Bifidobacterium avesanii]KAB8295429.1 hypothetical protein DSM100685_0039 [Bifidobacterium avesanii]NEG77435.1 hypothetical protein [Bifidobacterium avesanii]
MRGGTHTHGAIRPFAAVLAIFMLGGCGSAPNEHNEQFVDGTAQSGGQWQAVADAITADGEVTRAETEQAIASYHQCLAQNHFSGNYRYDLDTYFWVNGGSYGLDADAPGYPGLPERFRKKDWTDEDDADFAAWMKSDEGRRRMDENRRIEEQYEAPCKPFDAVRDLASSQVDWAWYDRNKFDAIQRCIAANAPSYAERAKQVQYRYTDTMEGTALLTKALYGDDADWPELANQPKTSEEYKLALCVENPTGAPMHYFGSAEYRSGDEP